MTNSSRLQGGSGSDRLVQPRLDLPFADIGDGVALAVGTLACFGRTLDHLAVAGKAGEGGIDLTEGKGSFPAEVGVVVALEVVAVARLPVEQAEQGQRHVAHRRRLRLAHTLSQYDQDGRSGARGSPVVQRPQ